MLKRNVPTDDDPTWGRKQRPRYISHFRQSAGVRLAEYLAHQTRDGEEMIDRLLEIARQPRSTPDRAREARAAITWILERIGGKPVQALHVTGNGATLGAPLDLDALMSVDDDTLDALDEAITKALPSGVIDAKGEEK